MRPDEVPLAMAYLAYLKTGLSLVRNRKTAKRCVEKPLEHCISMYRVIGNPGRKEKALIERFAAHGKR